MQQPQRQQCPDNNDNASCRTQSTCSHTGPSHSRSPTRHSIRESHTLSTRQNTAASSFTGRIHPNRILRAGLPPPPAARIHAWPRPGPCLHTRKRRRRRLRVRHRVPSHPHSYPKSRNFSCSALACGCARISASMTEPEAEILLPHTLPRDAGHQSQKSSETRHHGGSCCCCVPSRRSRTLQQRLRLAKCPTHHRLDPHTLICVRVVALRPSLRNRRASGRAALPNSSATWTPEAEHFWTYLHF